MKDCRIRAGAGWGMRPRQILEEGGAVKGIETTLGLRTIYTAAKEIESAGGNALPLQVDVRSEEQVAEAVAECVRQFGGLDILVNNASAIQLKRADATELKRYDLMQDINARGTFLCSKLCLPHLIGRENPHVLTMAPLPLVRTLNLERSCWR